MSNLPSIIKAETLRRIGQESIPRVKKCLSLLNDEQIWRKPNQNTASIGNLVLHLLGNVRQWGINTLGNKPDHRDRNAEFSKDFIIPVVELNMRLDHLMTDLEQVLQKLKAADLTKTYHVQCYEETGVAILMHITEHFSYHTGQISLHTKLLLDLDLGYYAEDDLNAKP